MNVDIPEDFLLTIAVYGRMGDGELPDLMRIWAQNKCRENGLYDKMVELQKQRLAELDKRIRNVMGDAPIEKLYSDIGKVARAINKEMR